MWVKEAKDDIEQTYRERPSRVKTQREVDPCNRDVWRSNVRSAMRAASQIPGGGPLMLMVLLHLQVTSKW